MFDGIRSPALYCVSIECPISRAETLIYCATSVADVSVQSGKLFARGVSGVEWSGGGCCAVNEVSEPYRNVLWNCVEKCTRQNCENDLSKKPICCE